MPYTEAASPVCCRARVLDVTPVVAAPGQRWLLLSPVLLLALALQDFANMPADEIKINISNRRDKIFLLMEELRRLRIQQRLKVGCAWVGGWVFMVIGGGGCGWVGGGWWGEGQQQQQQQDACWVQTHDTVAGRTVVGFCY